MKKFVIFAVALVFVVGCGVPPPSMPQEKAAIMIDEEIQQIQVDISNHSSRLPSDRERWTKSSLDIETQLYRRLDDLHRQRQNLAVDVANQKFDPKSTPAPESND